jgi:uncharacterized repeat protein (TIGR03803 family)
MKNTFLCVAVLVLSCGFAMGQPQENVLYSFVGGTDGVDPFSSGVVFDKLGNLYGTTEYGGTGPCSSNGNPAGCGTVFELSPNSNGTWTETVIHTFLGTPSGDGAFPFSGIVIDGDGNLYGTTWGGGRNECGGDQGCGTVFELSPSAGEWDETVIFRFTPGAGGTNPYAGVVLDSTGNLYGATWQDAYNSHPQIFELKLAHGQWNYHVLSVSPSDIPANLLIDPEGNLYGMGVDGGYKNNGMIGELMAHSDGRWKQRLIHAFHGSADGGQPFGGLTFDSNTGYIYGTTTGNPGGSDSTVFKLTPSSGGWLYDKIFTFCCFDEPYGFLSLDDSGDLYGTTTRGGVYQDGDVYTLTLGSDGQWTETILHSFTLGSDGGPPYAGVIRDSSGNLYGTTVNGGAYGFGTVFEITP